MYLGVEENFWYPLMTLLTASKKSFSEMDFLRARIANMPASVHTDRSSAPVVLGHSLATSSYRMSLSTFIDLEWMLRMCARPSRSGRPNSTCVFGEGESETGSARARHNDDDDGDDDDTKVFVVHGECHVVLRQG